MLDDRLIYALFSHDIRTYQNVKKKDRLRRAIYSVRFFRDKI